MEKRKINKILFINSYSRNGGPIVISLLCKLLEQRGYNAQLMVFPYLAPIKLFNQYVIWRDWVRFHTHNWIKKKINKIFSLLHIRKQLETWDFPYSVGRKCKKCFNPFFSRSSTLVVYPEIIHGNFLNAHNVVRWLLYHYKYANDSTAYSKNDVFICFRSVFNDWNLNPQGIETLLIYFEKDWYRQYNFGRRKHHCYLLRKGRSRDDLPESFDAPIIDGDTPDDEICRLFNEYKYCYFYDTQTFFCTLALVCGCIPVVIPEAGKSRKDYRKGGDSIGYGIAYDNTPEEIKFAVETRDKALESLTSIDIRNEKSVDNFLSCLQERYILEKRNK